MDSLVMWCHCNWFWELTNVEDDDLSADDDKESKPSRLFSCPNLKSDIWLKVLFVYNLNATSEYTKFWKVNLTILSSYFV